MARSTTPLPVLDLRQEFGLLSRFGGAGLVTTAVGLAVILALDVGLSVDRRLANAAGYAVGMALGLFLQKHFVFRRTGRERGLALRYGAAMAIAFGLNQVALNLAALAIPPTPLGRTAAQLLAMGTYTTAQFALFRLWVFRARS